MTDLAGTVTDVEAEIRWREWQARGAASDQRAAASMRRVMLLAAAVIALWFAVRLA